MSTNNTTNMNNTHNVKKRARVRGKFQARHDQEKMRSEFQRLKTFRTWSKTCPIRPDELAKEGFYYVGILDRVKCFSCGGQIEEWKEGETARGEHESWYPHCDMVKNIEKKNVPLDETLNDLKKNKEAGKEEPDGSIVLDISITKKSIHSVTSKDLVDALCGTSFTGDLTPALNPLYKDELDRLDTFRDKWSDDFKLAESDTRWLANAGFIYTGPGDRTRCFYCNGGIECWEDDDEPWSEHAKNFPTCKWLIAMKGKDFVDEVQDAKAREEAESKSKDRSAAPTQSSNPPQEATVPKAVTSTSLVEMMGTPTVTVILKTGFDPALVCRILEAQMREGELNFTSSDNFIKALWAAEKQKDSPDGTPGDHSEQSSNIDTQTQRFANLEITGDQSQEKSQTTQSDPGNFVTANSSVGNQSPTTASTTASPTGPTTGYPQWTGLERLVCRVCNFEDVSTVFCPCNHEAACLQCARVALTCPECGLPVNTYERTSGFI